MFSRSRKTLPVAATFKDFVRYPHFFLRTLCLQPYTLHDTESSNRFHYRLLGGVVFTIYEWNQLLCAITQVAFIYEAFNNDQFFVVIMNLAYVVYNVVSIIITIYIWYKRRQIEILMDRLQEIFPRTWVEQHEFDLTRYLRQCTFITSSYSLLVMVVIWLHNLYPILEYLIYDLWLHVRTVEQSLPYKGRFPWDWRGHWTFYVLYIAQVITGYSAVAGHISADLLLVVAITQMVMHFDHIARRLEEYEMQLGRRQIAKKLRRDGGFQMIGEGGPGGQSSVIQTDMQFLCGIIEYHANVLGLTDIMNDVFGVPLFVNFMTSSSIICFLGFAVTIGVTPDIFVKLVIYLISTMTQVYLICHYGQLLIDSSINVADSACHHDWTNADVRYQKMLVLVANRAQRPACIKATSFLSISRFTMTDIMQASYKFYALIRTMYAE